MKRFTVLLSVFFSAAAFAQDLPKIAVYATGNVAESQKRAVGTRMLVALANSGYYNSVEDPQEFVEAVEKKRAAQSSAPANKSYIYALAKQFGADAVCIIDITAISDGEYQILARVINTETAQVVAIGDFYGPVKSASDIKQVTEELLGAMLASPKETSAVPSQPSPEPASPSRPVVSSSIAQSSVVSVTGDVKDVVERVVTAVKAVNDATTESVAAVNAVTQATQQRNFSAIMQAKQKVESAAAAVKKAKDDAEVAVEAVKAAGPDAVAAAQAMGIDLSMFMGASNSGEEGEPRGGVDVYFSPKFLLRPDKTAYGGDVEFGIIWGKGAFIGFDGGYAAGKGYSLGGGSLNFGYVYNVTAALQMTYGTSVGYWGIGFDGYDKMTPLGYVGPFVKFR